MGTTDWELLIQRQEQHNKKLAEVYRAWGWVDHTLTRQQWREKQREQHRLLPCPYKQP